HPAHGRTTRPRDTSLLSPGAYFGIGRFTAARVGSLSTLWWLPTCSVPVAIASAGFSLSSVGGGHRAQQPEERLQYRRVVARAMGDRQRDPRAVLGELAVGHA